MAHWSSPAAMFDGEFTFTGVPYYETIYHSKYCSGSSYGFDYGFEYGYDYGADYGSDYGGITVTFINAVEFVDLEIYTRTDCCRDRYNSVGDRFCCTNCLFGS